MSLDVYLQGPAEEVGCTCSTCWHTHTREIRATVFEQNITHNLGAMAAAAGIYKACWRPEEIGVTTAAQLIPLLEAGLAKLKANPEEMKKHEAKNGWGLYEHFVPWVEKYLAACREFPDAHVEVSR